MLNRLLSAIRNLVSGRAIDTDLENELDSYQQLLVAEKVRAGMTPEAARRAARIESGGHDATAEAVRDVRAGALVEQLRRDLRYAFRTLGRSPGFTSFTLLTFAIAIGGLTIIFSLVNAVLLRPLPYPESDRLAMILEASGDNPVGGGNVSAPNFLDWQRQNNVFERMALYEYLGFNLSDGDEPEQVQALRVTGGVFDLLRVPPMLGRGILPTDDNGTNGKVVVLSHRLWQRRFGSDSSLVGKAIRMNGESWQVVGVMPKGFAFPSSGQELWVPIALNAEDQSRGSHSFFVVGRLKSGVTMEQAHSAMRVIAAGLAQQYPLSNVGMTANVFPMRDLWVWDVQETLRTLMIAVGLVLLIASANIASLRVARDSGRRREIAARMALGGSRGRIIAQLLTESVVLALGGAIIGLGLAAIGIRHLVTLFPPNLRNVPFRDLSAVSLDAKVATFAVIVALVTGIVVGLIPALTVMPDDPADVLREGGARSGVTRKSGRLKRALVGFEVALAMVVLVGAGLLIASIRRVQQVAPGLDVSNVMVLGMELPQPDFYGPAQRKSFCSDVVREVGALPGVTAVSAVSHLPLSGSSAGRDFAIEGAPDPGPENMPGGSYGVACPGYFHAMGIALRAGREFTEQDQASTPPVVIVNQRLADRYFPNGNAVGSRFKLGGFDSSDPWRTIVGVAADVHHNGLAEDPRPYFWAPYPQAAWPRMGVVVRTRAAPLSESGVVRTALKRAVPGEPIGQAFTMEEVLDRSLGHLRFPMVLFGVFAGIALALAALGCFGVASQTVVQRRRELAIRIALGARAIQVSRMVIAQTMAPVVWGLLAGVAGALAGTRLLSQLLYGITPTDPMTLGLGAAVMALATVAACAWPARRAARVDPAGVLRED